MNAIFTFIMFMTPSTETYMQTQTQDQNQNTKKTQRLPFRSSCDPCAASKVRCTKEQQGCSRCVQKGLKCVYGRSRRKGKPPSKKTASAHAPLNPPSSQVPVSPPALPAPTPPSWSTGPNHHQTNYNHSCSWYRSTNPIEWERRTRNSLNLNLTPGLTPHQSPPDDDAGISHLPMPGFPWPDMAGSDPMVTDGDNLSFLPEIREIDDENGGAQERDEVRQDQEDDQNLPHTSSYH